MEIKNTDSIVEIAKKRYEAATTYYSDSRSKANDDARFAWGGQWPSTIRTQRGTIENKPCLTINTTAQHCNQVINNIRQNRPTGRVLPADNYASIKTGEILAGLIRIIQSNSNADDAHDTAAETCIEGGDGFWRVITDYKYNSSFAPNMLFDQANDIELKIKPITNPNSVTIDPYAVELDKSDAQWGFVEDTISKEDCKRLYGVDPANWNPNGKSDWNKTDGVKIADYYYCEYIKDTLLELADGSCVLKSKIVGGEMLGKRSRKVQIPKWWHCKLVGDEPEPVEKVEWPGVYLPIIWVVGKERNIDGKIERKGLVRDLIDIARIVNYSYSAAVETIALQNKIPYMASVEATRNLGAIYANANLENRAWLPWNEFDQAGNRLTKPERQMPATMPQAQIGMLQLSEEQMRAASGQQNANFGAKSEASSGIGIQRLKVQGDTATFHFPDNLQRGLKHEMRILVDLIPKVYDVRQVVTVLGLDGKHTKHILDPEFQDAHADINQDDIETIFNPNIGSYNVVIDTGASYATQRQETADKLMELSTKNPQLMAVAGDIVVRTLDIPGVGEQLAERLEKALPPGLQDKDDKQGQQGPTEDPQAVQQMNMMADQIEHLSQELKASHEAEQKAEQEVMKAQNALLAEQNKRLKLESDMIKESAERAKEEALEVLHGEHDKLTQSVNNSEQV